MDVCWRSTRTSSLRPSSLPQKTGFAWVGRIGSLESLDFVCGDKSSTRGLMNSKRTGVLASSARHIVRQAFHPPHGGKIAPLAIGSGKAERGHFLGVADEEETGGDHGVGFQVLPSRTVILASSVNPAGDAWTSATSPSSERMTRRS